MKTHEPMACRTDPPLIGGGDATSCPVERVSADDLFSYRITERDQRGQWVFDIQVDQVSASSQGPSVLRGFTSQGAVNAWVDSHANSTDLGEFAVLRAARAMHSWQRHEADQSTVRAAG